MKRRITQFTGANYPRTLLGHLLSSCHRVVAFSPFYLFQSLKPHAVTDTVAAGR